jgi:hypothetical protein
MGYRLVPAKLTYPAQVTAGQQFGIAGEWVNRAVGRAMQDFPLRLSLVNDAGKAVATADAGRLGTDRWVKGKTYAAQGKATFADAPAGEHALHVSLVDPRDGKPIQLPLKGRSADGSYPVGKITIVARP